MKSNFIEKLVDIYSQFLNITIIFLIINILIELVSLFIKLPIWMDKILPVAVRAIFFIVLLSASIVMGVSFKYFIAFLVLFISSKIRMPFYPWVEINFPPWLTVIVVLVFGISMVLIGFPQKNKQKLNSIVFLIFLLSSILVVPCLNIGPSINSLILFLSFILFCFLALSNNKKRMKEKENKNRNLNI